jgi:hypothetical protein
MTLLLGETIRLLAGLALWSLVLAAVGALGAYLVGIAHRQQPDTRKIVIAAIGALAAAGLSNRLGLPWQQPIIFDRPFPAAWAALGAVVAAELHLRLGRLSG